MPLIFSRVTQDIEGVHYVDFSWGGSYSLNHMKIVTKRFGKEDPILGSKILQKTVSRLRGKELVPRGLYRFKTFKEADQWMLQTIASIHAFLNSKTS